MGLAPSPSTLPPSPPWHFSNQICDCEQCCHYTCSFSAKKEHKRNPNPHSLPEPELQPHLTPSSPFVLLLLLVLPFVFLPLLLAVSPLSNCHGWRRTTTRTFAFGLWGCCSILKVVAVILVVPRLIAVVAVVVIVLVALVVVVHFMRHINGRPKSHRRQVNKAATSYTKNIFDDGCCHN